MGLVEISAITLPWTSTFDGAERAAPFPSKMRTFSKSTSSALAVAQSPSTRAAASLSLPERSIMKTGRTRKNNGCGAGHGMRHDLAFCQLLRFKGFVTHDNYSRFKRRGGHGAWTSCSLYGIGVKKRSGLASFAMKGRVESQADRDDTRASSARFALGSEQTILTKHCLRVLSVKNRLKDFRFGSIPAADRKSSIVRSWRKAAAGPQHYHIGSQKSREALAPGSLPENQAYIRRSG